MTVTQRWMVAGGAVSGAAVSMSVLSLMLPLHAYLIDANISLSSLSVWTLYKWDASRKATKKRRRTGIWD